MILKEKFISASCNPRSHCLEASRVKNVVLYASNLQIAVQTIPEAENQVGKIISLSEKRHSKPITTLKRIKNFSGEDEQFISGGVDGTVVLWDFQENLEYLANLEGASGSIGCICGSSNSSRKVLAASWVSESSSGFQAWWTGPQGQVSNSYAINLDQNAFALCLDSIFLENVAILAVGTSKRFVELFSENENRTAFQKLISVAGHTDWIHSIAFNDNPENLLLASAGQDTFVRLWKIEKDEESTVTQATVSQEELTSSKNKFSISGVGKMRISSYAVMQGHDDWVHSTNWNQQGNVLLTASSDKTCIIWREIDDLFRDDVRLGIVGGQAAGFFSAVFSASAEKIIASSYFGGLHGWKCEDPVEKTFWNAITMTGGHVGEVRDLDWQRTGGFLISCGEDQTTRVFAREHEEGENQADRGFVEIARPQVHGHDMQCISMVNESVFVSGAEEKIFRAFRAPKSFAQSLEAISEISLEETFKSTKLAEFGACVPALGLSNKAMCEGETVDGEHWEEDAFRAAPTVLKTAPTEDTLQQNTLWPEEHKLYGHGYEVYAVATNPTGKVLATACKSSHIEHSVIILWSTEDWSKKSEIVGHQLTVTQISWNFKGTLLLSVSRDRTAKLYRENEGNVDGFNYQLIWSSTPKHHSRIIWSCDWFKTPESENQFITASRDQKIIIWNFNEAENQAIPICSQKSAEPVTAISVQPSENPLIVAGFQSGLLEVYRFLDGNLTLLQRIGASPISVDSPVTRIRFSPQNGRFLAVSSADAKLRIFEVSSC
ncbi:unnamed protein product [Caenorhabditis angaria]|uniref:Elongator complex protein 2 n=1 Tax=Caenorhabditis angaria TaxID=860376 RepID=A0A9P1IGR3_9PELO|nr:unnamed protein product [Caenorhabditis angaria]